VFLSLRRGGAVVIVLDVLQRSTSWLLARCGLLTGSRARHVLARETLFGGGIGRERYLRQLVREQLTGIPEDVNGYVSGPMRRGRELEAAARKAYAAHAGVEVLTSGFVRHDELAAGSSLDGHVEGFAGVVEIKAPNTATHLRYCATRRIPAHYVAQITHHLWITGAEWCDFVSFDDRLPARVQLLVLRFTRRDVDVEAYGRAARRFLADVAAAAAAIECEAERRLARARRQIVRELCADYRLRGAA
jgi:hypothetical protein